MTAKNPLRRGFTLVELLVVISIIGVLVGLLLPAVQSARESARRMQCQNNLKQLSLAVRNYESSMKSLPPAITTQGTEKPVTYDTLRPGWTIAILPYMEQQNLYDLVDRTQPMNAASNLPVRSVRLAAYVCPTETNSRTPCSRASGNWARGNYGANVGMVNPQSTAAYGAGSGNDQWIGTQRGVMGANAALKMAQIKDGTSNTIMLMELRSGLSASDIRGTWAMGQCGANALCTTANNVSGSGGPNTC
ncbi:MAG TPA: DUF1559 domain-containing protein, partial [Pirellulaceae bacterium]|nr:DUF1559 domain-containing protein [Pirellulaceae bacterium]